MTAQSEHLLRSCYYHVAVDADARQQQQPAVCVDGVGCTHDLAERLREDPTQVSVNGLQWDREEQEEVSQRQVEQEDICHGAKPEAAVESKGGDDQAVSHNAQQEDDAENTSLEGSDDASLVLISFTPVRVMVIIRI